MSQALPKSSEAPATTSESVSRPRWAGALSALLLVLLCVHFIRLPVFTADASHDLGSHMAFEWYALHHYKFGIDVIQNVGPYGYLQYPADYSGLLPGRKLVFSISLGILLGLLSHRALHYFQRPEKALWIACLFLMPIAPLYAIDPLIYLLMLLAGHHLIYRRSAGDAWLLSGVIWFSMALLCLMKTTNLAIATLLLCVTIVCNLLDRRFRLIAFDLLCFVASFIGLWLLADQRLANFLPFLRDTLRFTAGYNEAMQMIYNNENQMLLLAAAAISLFVLANLVRLRHPARNRARLLLAIYEAGCIFVVWKHAYVREDPYHVYYFWCVLLPAGPLLLLAHPEPAAERSPVSPRPLIPVFRSSPLNPRRLNFIAALVLARLCFLAYSANELTIEYPWEQIVYNSSFALHWKSRMGAFENELAATQKSVALAGLTTSPGDATIDDFGPTPGIILLNGWNYHPRPMAISFAAYSEAIQRDNAEFYENPQSAPQYLLDTVGSIDDRFYPQDDALAQLQVLAHYRLKWEDSQDQYALLQREEAANPIIDPQPLDSHTLHAGEWAAIPARKNAGLWCKVWIKPTLLGQIRSLLFKPAMIDIHLGFGDSSELIKRFLAGEGASGFLIDPIILNQRDLLPLVGGAADVNHRTPPITRIMFTFQNDWSWQNDIDVKFFPVKFSTVEFPQPTQPR